MKIGDKVKDKYKQELTVQTPATTYSKLIERGYHMSEPEEDNEFDNSKRWYGCVASNGDKVGLTTDDLAENANDSNRHKTKILKEFWDGEDTEISYKIGEDSVVKVVSAGIAGDVHIDSEELEEIGILDDIQKGLEDALASENLNESKTFNSLSDVLKHAKENDIEDFYSAVGNNWDKFYDDDLSNKKILSSIKEEPNHEEITQAIIKEYSGYYNLSESANVKVEDIVRILKMEGMSQMAIDTAVAGISDKDSDGQIIDKIIKNCDPEDSERIKGKLRPLMVGAKQYKLNEADKKLSRSEVVKLIVGGSNDYWITKTKAGSFLFRNKNETLNTSYRVGNDPYASKAELKEYDALNNFLGSANKNLIPQADYDEIAHGKKMNENVNLFEASETLSKKTLANILSINSVTGKKFKASDISDDVLNAFNSEWKNIYAKNPKFNPTGDDIDEEDEEGFDEFMELITSVSKIDPNLSLFEAFDCSKSQRKENIKNLTKDLNKK